MCKKGGRFLTRHEHEGHPARIVVIFEGDLATSFTSFNPFHLLLRSKSLNIGSGRCLPAPASTEEPHAHPHSNEHHESRCHHDWNHLGAEVFVVHIQKLRFHGRWGCRCCNVRRWPSLRGHPELSLRNRHCRSRPPQSLHNSGPLDFYMTHSGLGVLILNPHTLLAKTDFNSGPPNYTGPIQVWEPQIPHTLLDCRDTDFSTSVHSISTGPIKAWDS